MEENEESSSTNDNAPLKAKNVHNNHNHSFRKDHSKFCEGNLSSRQEEWLREERLIVKIMPRNHEPLFRAMAESFFQTQVNYEKLKQQVIKYLAERKYIMEKRVRLAYGKEMASKPCGQLERHVYDFGMAIGKEPVTPWHAYMYRLANGSNVAGLIEIDCISHLYKCNIWVYRSIPSSPLVFGNYESKDTKTIKLLNVFGSSHYDLLIPASKMKPTPDTPEPECQCDVSSPEVNL